MPKPRSSPEKRDELDLEDHLVGTGTVPEPDAEAGEVLIEAVGHVDPERAHHAPQHLDKLRVQPQAHKVGPAKGGGEHEGAQVTRTSGKAVRESQAELSSRATKVAPTRLKRGGPHPHERTAMATGALRATCTGIG